MFSSEWRGFTLHVFSENYWLLTMDEAALVLNVVQLEVRWQKKRRISETGFRLMFLKMLFFPWLCTQLNFAQQNDHCAVETLNSDFNYALIRTISKDTNWCQMWLDHCSARRLLICFPLPLYCREASIRWLITLIWSRIQRNRNTRAYHQSFYSVYQHFVSTKAFVSKMRLGIVFII